MTTPFGLSNDNNRGSTPRPAILQVIPRLDTGGAERATIDIARALTREGWRALVVSEGGRMEPELSDAGGILMRLPVASKNPLTIFANSRRLLQIIRNEHVALVHARSRAPAWSALLATRAAKVPFVTTFHGIYNAKSAVKRWYNSVMTRGDVVIANSQWTARHIQARYPNLPKPPVVIPRGLHLNAFDPAQVSPSRVRQMLEKWRVPDTARVLLLPGRLTRWKGQTVFVDALAALARSGRLADDAYAVLIGDAQGRDTYVAELRDAIHRAGLDGRVVLAGHEHDMPAAYAAAAMVVSASTDPEAFGRVSIEAAAMARPVIATAHGGSLETVMPGQSGLLVPPGDVAALADAIVELLSAAPARLMDMGARGRAHVAATYSTERMCAATLDVYRSLLGDEGPRMAPPSASLRSAPPPPSGGG